MATTDLFGSGREIKLNSKWSIANYLSSPTGHRSPSLSSQTANEQSDIIKQELERAINQINSTYNRSSMDFDKIFKDLSTRRKELKAFLTEVQVTAKPVDIAALWGVESNLITSQMRALENKQKIEAERFKQIRDEKKLAKDRSSTSDGNNSNTNNGVTNIITNSPLSTSEQLASSNTRTTGIDISNIPSDLLMRTGSKFNTSTNNTITDVTPSAPQVIEHKETIPDNIIPTTDNVETTAEQTVVTTPSVENGNIGGLEGETVVTTDITGLHPITVNDVVNGMNERVSKRLQQRDETLNTKTMTGYSLNTSLQTLVAKSTPHKEKLYVAPDGRYYVRAFEVDGDGNYTNEMTQYPYKSLTHLGSLSFSPLHHKVNYYYYPDPKDYELVDSMDSAPDFYKDEWNKPKNEKYVLDTDTVNTLFESR